MLGPLAAEVLYYAAREAMRNAALHGRDRLGERPLCLRVGIAWRAPAKGSQQGRLEVWVEDDGVGLPASAPPVGGDGQGLALHSTMMAVIGGTLAIESLPGVRTRVLLTLPMG